MGKVGEIDHLCRVKALENYDQSKSDILLFINFEATMIPQYLEEENSFFKLVDESGR